MQTTMKSLRLMQVQKMKAGENWFLKIIIATVILLSAVVSASAQQGGKYFNNVDANGVILDGYDPVAFFTDNKPVKGDAHYQFKYQDATYYFASQEHLDLFKASPDKSKTQSGAWSAYAVSLGRTTTID